jgi:programmed cell death protein 4
VQAFKAAALDIVREYFDSGDAGEVATRLAELQEPGCLNVFVKHVSVGVRGCPVLLAVGGLWAVGWLLPGRLVQSALAAWLFAAACSAQQPISLLPDLTRAVLLPALHLPSFLPPALPAVQAVQLAMDRKDRERELVSALLPGLTPAVVPPEQAALGFTRLLAGLDDLALDIPEAPRLMELFLGESFLRVFSVCFVGGLKRGLRWVFGTCSREVLWRPGFLVSAMVALFMRAA